MRLLPAAAGANLNEAGLNRRKDDDGAAFCIDRTRSGEARIEVSVRTDREEAS